MHVYSELSPTEFGGTYSHVSMYRFAVISYQHGWFKTPSTVRAKIQLKPKKEKKFQ